MRRTFFFVAFCLLCLVSRAQDAERLERIEKQIGELKSLVESLKPAANAPAAAPEKKAKDAIARIREEGLERSEAMATLTHLTEVIGPRLTGSPGMKRANEWTRERLESWGLTAKVEPWGEFGRGWTLKRFSAQVVEPLAFPVIAFPKAWSPGLEDRVSAEVVYVDTTSTENMEKQKGKLKGKIALISKAREVSARFEPLARRYDDAELLRFANAGEGRLPPAAVAKGQAQTQAQTPRPRPEGGVTLGRALAFLENQGAVAAVTVSQQGDGGAIFLTAATFPGGPMTNAAPAPRVWATNANFRLPQIMMAVEDYNRIMRLLKAEQTVRMDLDLKVEFDSEDMMAANTLAEIPGTDLKDEVVMLGAHLDSWHGGTGATDNGVGVTAMMEAVRIIQTLELKPKRTIRIALWSGEEQGLLGSKAFVSNHFGFFTNISVTNIVASAGGTNEAKTNVATKKLFVRKPGYEQVSAYFNYDYGPGKIRGICVEGNEAARPIFRDWLWSFRDLGAETVSAASLGSTDHVSFDAVGIPGFQFIQDPLEYSTRTHHSTQDVLDRIQADDLKQAATIIAAFVYNAAMHETKLPRKKAPEFFEAPAEGAKLSQAE